MLMSKPSSELLGLLLAVRHVKGYFNQRIEPLGFRVLGIRV